jgi:hypothetical protein
MNSMTTETNGKATEEMLKATQWKQGVTERMKKRINGL